MKPVLRYLLAAAALMLCCGGAYAQTREEVERQIREYEEEARRARELAEKTGQTRAVNETQLKVIVTQIAAQRNKINALDRRIGVIRNDITAKTNDIERLRREIGALKRDYADMIYAAYKNYKLNNFVLFLFSSDDFNMATRRMDFMRRYNRMRRMKADEIKTLSDSLAREVSRLDHDRSEMDNTRKVHDGEVAQLGKDESEYKKNIAQLTAEQSRYQQTVKEKQALIDKAQKELDRIIAEEIRRSRNANVSDADARVLAEISGRFDENKGKLPFPIKGGVIIDRFGEHAHQVVRNTKINNPGVNIAGSPGAAVNCVFEGRVMEIVSIPTYNRCIIVRHGNYITVYANLVSVAVKKGDTVALGQMLGRIDSNADSDANFLHFEIRRETETLNPEQWLRK
ncbi:peptidoglycan DD-metalloendopeptidase family protein [Alistipes sp. OttesenSCG-928-B03]|nr:peptidoglycan DD-metalloendopeptidase family protein [Alistipes sp. OttesenSCG-928-B03]